MLKNSHSISLLKSKVKDLKKIETNFVWFRYILHFSGVMLTYYFMYFPETKLTVLVSRSAVRQGVDFGRFGMGEGR